jgi:hypothetical protein
VRDLAGVDLGGLALGCLGTMSTYNYVWNGIHNNMSLKARQNDQPTVKQTVAKHFHKFLQCYLNDKMM